MTNNNSNNNSKFSWKEIVLMILSLIGTMVIVNWIADKVSTWLANLLFPEKENTEEAKKKAAIKAAEPLLKEAVKNVKPIKFSDLEKTMGSLDKVVKEVINEDQVPENIKEKIEKVTVKKMSEEELPEDIKEAVNASKTKTFINGKIYDKVDQFINDCKALKRSRIGSHQVIVGDINLAKKIKSKLTNEENEFVKFYKDLGYDPDRLSCINFINGYFIWVNEYIDLFDCYCDKVSFEETDSIINKYFGEI